MDATFLPQLEAHKKYEALAPETRHYLRLLFKMLAKDVIEPVTTTRYGPQSKQVNIKFPSHLIAKWPHLEIHQISDVQFGHKDCKVDKVIELREHILAEPYRFVVLTGDMIDAAHAYTPGSSFDNIFDAQNQIYRFTEIMAPMRHRVLGYVGGNHERRGIPVFGDLGILLATMLQVPYSDGRQYLNIQFGDHKPFRILLWHGHPRARTKGALAQIMDRFMQIGNAQIYLTGHNHQALVVPNFREVTEHGKIRLEKYIGASGTSFLKTYGAYAEWMGFSAYDVLMPMIVLYKDRKWELRVT